MHQKDLIQRITKFLNVRESSAEKQDVLFWYDEQSTLEEVDSMLTKKVQQGAKRQLMKSISKKSKIIGIKKIVWYAAAILIVAGLGIWIGYRNLQIKTEVASPELLASIKPAQERAIITLESGEEIDLDNLAMNEKIQFGDIVISKDGNGKVSYHNVQTGDLVINTNTLRVPKASTYSLMLTDGTLVTLNSDSKLTYPTLFKDGDRVVQLEGEAYFEVQKTANKSRFIVQTNQQNIQVLGTKFNVKAYPADHKSWTSLKEGSVKVSLNNSQQEAVLLKPDHQAESIDNETIKVKSVQIDDIISWTKGQFNFNGNNTVEVLEEIARWYDIDIDYQKSKNQTEQYKGKIPRNQTLDQLIKLLNYADLKTEATIGKNQRIKLHIY